ncbi:EmrB/QacA subfamily drug resistance transporter [Bacillus mesophilus]|uniref:MFS transporter n=1 Tax=Bacillus mesophilus TaxID=1808955 RepID=A0A6M0Q7Z9_9BACI|nr:MDR family MFS transporter [Bacillus mesophilus]MBM7662168.1 EmrB/QacA subfamily drug resistance transporter [Bacillus mesophilus]NEY72481.1 MFS transporter [Bacillus mesophilus]
MKKETKPRLVVIALLIATFLTAIEGTIVSTAMPKIVGDLGGSTLYTWVISIYLLAMVISTPVFGKLADLYGRKLMFTIGTIIFLVGSGLSGLSQTMEQLVLFRGIQGIGAGALTPILFTIIGDVFEFKMRAKMQGWLSSVWGVAGIIGPLTGGFIVDTISWHWIFFINIPFGIVSLLILWISFHEHIEKKKHVIDYAGILTFAICMSSFLYALTLLREYKHMTESIVSLFIVALIGLLLFIWLQLKGKEPMLPLSLFKNRFITIANVAGFLLGFILVTITFYIPLWVQGVMNLNATFSGIAMIPMSLTWPLAAILSGRWLSSKSIAQITLTGISSIIVGCIGLALLQSHTTIIWIMVVTAIIGFGFGLSFTAFTVAVQSAVEWNIRGAAMGSNTLMRNLGQVIGIAVTGLLLSTELGGIVLETSLQAVFSMLVLLAVCAFAVTGALLTKKGKELAVS